MATGLLSLAAAPALGQAPGLPRTYDVSVINPAEPLPGGGGNFGWGVTSADLTGDGRMELIVAQSEDHVPGKISIYDGATNRHIETLGPPERNPVGTPEPGEALAFVYVERMADIGGCPSGDGGDSDKICDDARVGPRDGIPEIVAGSRTLQVDPTSPLDSERTVDDPSAGRGYVFDGRTRAVLKRIDMPPAHRESQRARGALRSFGSPQFGRTMISPQGLPPCAGPASEANNAGLGPCEELPAAVRLGDVDGGGVADIVAGARAYRYTSTPGRVNTAPVGSQCGGGPGGTPAPTAPVFNSTASTCAGGKAFVYKGEEIVNSSPLEILDGVTDGNATGVSTPETEPKTLTNPFPQSDHLDGFQGMMRLGDVGSCTPTAGAGPPAPVRCASRNFAPDGKPEIIASDAFLDYPVLSPDLGSVDVGAAYVFDGASGQFRDIYENPEPEPRAVFSHSFSAGWAPGNLGHSTLPDFLTGAPVQSVRFVADGRAYVYNGEATNPRGRLIGVLDDPTPKPAGNFGSSYTGVGDLVSDPTNPANEVMIGSHSPYFTSIEAAQALISDVAIINPARARVLQTIPDPVQEPGSGFGMGITPMGDLNRDGFLDFGISSYLSNLPGQPADGRAYIFRSNDKPLPRPPTRALLAVSTPRLLRPGDCVNDTVGTAKADKLKGTTGGDRMFGFGGDDSIDGFDSADCLDGGVDDDRIQGGAARDRLIGGTGSDRLLGNGDRDRLFGGSGQDRLKGGSGADLLAGGKGNDRLDGGPATDRIYGEGGNDRIRAAGGRNTLDGGPGHDVIYARNHRRDVVRCGSGRDRIVADRTDRVQVDCERIRRPA